MPMLNVRLSEEDWDRMLVLVAQSGLSRSGYARQRLLAEPAPAPARARPSGPAAIVRATGTPARPADRPGNGEVAPRWKTPKR